MISYNNYLSFVSDKYMTTSGATAIAANNLMSLSEEQPPFSQAPVIVQATYSNYT